MDSKIMSSYIWEEINSFQSIGEFNRFQDWLNLQLNDGVITEIPVTAYYASENFHERWFKKHSGEIWRLVDPDFPFLGYWGPVR
ncbi:hypothetical protein HB991_11155 [Yersinia mollaretii]|uniref:Uncharacterized protein n=1 Tax=Yersinia mollaretii TaxID=33060 RepID=A0AA44CLR2_YERMO|nr:hypothetical protein [Yersinia mollaretii]CNL51718.1 Uncharacterised protein [Yersinia enterocolitica]NIL23065.1 hypothetical protein [Yersinia mollaretii]QKJ03177.1 hypothetical protein HRD69_09265 [Yersinia mollaretii ATCC 43969]CNJ57160.1 Uncharacterised protein [Yersinia mollaretii]CQR17531.1 Uncharacterised protein [Yersinia mollaretii]